MSYFMLTLSILYLLAEIAFRAFAIDKMGSLNLLHSEIQYLEMMGRIFAAFGFSLFFINLSKTNIILKKLMFFVLYFIVFFFAQKLIFDNIHNMASENLKNNSYSLNIYKNVVFTDKKLSSDLPYSKDNLQDIKFKTFFGMLPFLYSSSDKVQNYVEKNEDYFIKKIVNFKMNKNIDIQTEAFNNLRESTVIPLYEIHKQYSQFQPGSELHKQFTKFHFSAFGYYFLMTNKELFPDYSNMSMLEAGNAAFKTGIPEKLYIDLSLKSRRKVQGYLYTKIKQMIRKREIDVSSLPEGRFLDKTFFPNEYYYFYHNFSENHVIKYMRKRYNYEERLNKAINEYGEGIFNKEKITSEEYNALFEIVKSGNFDLFYSNPVIMGALDDSLMKEKELIKLIFSKDYNKFYINEDNYVNNFQYYLKERKYNEIKDLKNNENESVKAVLIPPIVILFSTIAVFLNMISIVFNIVKKINISKKYQFMIMFVFIFSLVFYPFNSFSENKREEAYYTNVIPMLEIPEYKIFITRWLINTNSFLNGKLGIYEELSSFMFSGFQLRNDFYLKEGSLEQIMIKENIEEKKKDIIKRYPEMGITITSYLT